MRPQNDPQRMLADAGRQFAADRCTSARIRACRDRVPDHDAVVWREMADLGWLSVLAPEADGGLGSGLGEMGQLAYEWGAACGPEPLVATGVLALTVLLDADGPARKALLESTMRGDSVAAVAWVDGSGTCEATRYGWTLNGSARFVIPADATDFLVVFATDSGHPSLHVGANMPGLSITREMRIDGTASALLDFKCVQVSEAGLLARAPSAAAASEHARDNTLVLAAVYMTGSMRSINVMTQEYLRTRTQFGKPIGSFQALQHKAVDMHIAEQLARDVAQNACTLIDAGCTPDERACLASRAKARAGEALDRIARMAVQLHGAIGFTDEYDLSLHLNRSLAMSAWLGNADEHVRRYARHAPPFEAAEA